MGFPQFHDEIVVETIDTSEVVKLARFKLAAATELKYIVTRLWKVGTPGGSETLTLKVYGSADYAGTAYATSAAVTLASATGLASTNALGDVLFTFDRQNLAAGVWYYLALTTTNYTRNASTYYLGSVRDWPHPINEVHGAGPGARFSIFGYRSDGMGIVKTLQASTGTSAGTVTGIDGTATAKSADYTVLDNDRIRTILMTTGASTRTVTLPTAADNTNRIITIKKVDSGAGLCTVDGEGAELIYGGASTNTTFPLYYQYDYVTLQCDGTGWHVLAVNGTSTWQTYSPSAYAEMTVSSNDVQYQRVGGSITIMGRLVLSAGGAGNPVTLTTPTGLALDTNFISTGNPTSTFIGAGSWSDNGVGNYAIAPYMASSTTIAFQKNVVAAGTTALRGSDVASSDVILFSITIPVAEFAHYR